MVIDIDQYIGEEIDIDELRDFVREVSKGETKKNCDAAADKGKKFTQRSLSSHSHRSHKSGKGKKSVRFVRAPLPEPPISTAQNPRSDSHHAQNLEPTPPMKITPILPNRPAVPPACAKCNTEEVFIQTEHVNQHHLECLSPVPRFRVAACDTFHKRLFHDCRSASVEQVVGHLGDPFGMGENYPLPPGIRRRDVRYNSWNQYQQRNQISRSESPTVRTRVLVGREGARVDLSEPNAGAGTYGNNDCRGLRIQGNLSSDLTTPAGSLVNDWGKQYLDNLSYPRQLLLSSNVAPSFYKQGEVAHWVKENYRREDYGLSASFTGGASEGGSKKTRAEVQGATTADHSTKTESGCDSGYASSARSYTSSNRQGLDRVFKGPSEVMDLLNQLQGLDTGVSEKKKTGKSGVQGHGHGHSHKTHHHTRRVRSPKPNLSHTRRVRAQAQKAESTPPTTPPETVTSMPKAPPNSLELSRPPRQPCQAGSPLQARGQQLSKPQTQTESLPGSSCGVTIEPQRYGPEVQQLDSLPPAKRCTRTGVEVEEVGLVAAWHVNVDPMEKLGPGSMGGTVPGTVMEKGVDPSVARKEPSITGKEVVGPGSPEAQPVKSSQKSGPGSRSRSNFTSSGQSSSFTGSSQSSSFVSPTSQSTGRPGTVDRANTNLTEFSEISSATSISQRLNLSNPELNQSLATSFAASQSQSTRPMTNLSSSSQRHSQSQSQRAVDRANTNLTEFSALSTSSSEPPSSSEQSQSGSGSTSGSQSATTGSQPHTLLTNNSTLFPSNATATGSAKSQTAQNQNQIQGPLLAVPNLRDSTSAAARRSGAQQQPQQPQQPASRSSGTITLSNTTEVFAESAGHSHSQASRTSESSDSGSGSASGSASSSAVSSSAASSSASASSAAPSERVSGSDSAKRAEAAEAARRVQEV